MFACEQKFRRMQHSFLFRTLLLTIMSERNLSLGTFPPLAHDDSDTVSPM